MRKKRILFIGLKKTVAIVENHLNSTNSLSLFVTGYQLSKKTSQQIRNSYFSTLIYEVTTPTKITHFSSVQQLNPLIPKIVVIHPAVRPFKVWRNSPEGYFDILHFPEHLIRLPVVCQNACYFNEQRKKQKIIKEKILETLDQLSIIIEAGKAITSTLKLDEVVNSIIDMITEVIMAEAWSLLLVDDESQELYFKAAHGFKSQKLKQFRLKYGQGIAGWVAQNKKSLIVNNVQNDPRFYKEVDLQTNFVTRSILCAPIIFKGKLLAVLEIINKHKNEPFRQKDLASISSLLDAAAIAIENAKLFNQVESLAVTDDLTYLYNTRFLNKVLESEIARALRYDTEVSFIFMDLDYFKQVNDSYGHMIGREALKEVASLMSKHFRETDLIARYGGDEFVIVLPETGTQETFKLAEDMRHVLEKHHFLRAFGNDVHLTASFGIATYPIHAKNKDDLIMMADKAMFQAKGECRNMVYIASKEDDCEVAD